MLSRPDLVADAAVTVLARDGLRGLTHRAVDAEARLPHGSTSNCFRSRAALLGAVVDRLEELDRVTLTAGSPPDPASGEALAAYLAANTALMTTPAHVRATRARLALLLDEAARPAIEAGHQHLLTMLEEMLREGGHADPAATARAISDLLEGALVHAAAVSSRSIDTNELSAAVQRLLS